MLLITEVLTPQLIRLIGVRKFRHRTLRYASARLHTIQVRKITRKPRIWKTVYQGAQGAWATFARVHSVTSGLLLYGIESASVRMDRDRISRYACCSSVLFCLRIGSGTLARRFTREFASTTGAFYRNIQV